MMQCHIKLSGCIYLYLEHAYPCNKREIKIERAVFPCSFTLTFTTLVGVKRESAAISLHLLNLLGLAGESIACFSLFFSLTGGMGRQNKSTATSFWLPDVSKDEWENMLL